MERKELIKALLLEGKAVLGIEFGSTRIKAVLVDEENKPIAEGGHGWENRLEDGIWTYTMEDIWTGLQACYAELKQKVQQKYGVTLQSLGAIGFSAMMHGYLAFDQAGDLLVPFRTWRNTMTKQATVQLSQLFQFNIPERWSIAHLHQAILNDEEHVKDIAYLTTLAGYIHWKLTGEKVIGIGDAAGMFPIDSELRNYHPVMMEQYQQLIEGKAYPWTLADILPKILVAGEHAGSLTKAGALLLDPSGDLQAGIPLCPPEGDAGTGMTATNSVKVRTGNVSAGTSIFAMFVLEQALKNYYEEIDMVTTPCGDAVAMVHCNNCTSDINGWIQLLGETLQTFGCQVDTGTLYETLFRKALEGDADCGGLMAVNYLSGESITGFAEGRPMFVRKPDAAMNLANFMRTHLLSSLATLKIGMDILMKQEQVSVDKMYGHGGLFKTEGVGQRFMAAALEAPVSVMETAGEGGAWGIALLASYMINKAEGQTLDTYLDQAVFCGNTGISEEPQDEDVSGFAAFMEDYKKVLAAERAAVEAYR